MHKESDKLTKWFLIMTTKPPRCDIKDPTNYSKLQELLLKFIVIPLKVIF